MKAQPQLVVSAMGSNRTFEVVFQLSLGRLRDPSIWSNQVNPGGRDARLAPGLCRSPACSLTPVTLINLTRIFEHEAMVSFFGPQINQNAS